MQWENVWMGAKGEWKERDDKGEELEGEGEMGNEWEREGRGESLQRGRAWKCWQQVF